jgi:hypothetical protein
MQNRQLQEYGLKIPLLRFARQEADEAIGLGPVKELAKTNARDLLFADRPE